MISNEQTDVFITDRRVYRRVFDFKYEYLKSSVLPNATHHHPVAAAYYQRGTCGCSRCVRVFVCVCVCVSGVPRLPEKKVRTTDTQPMM